MKLLCNRATTPYQTPEPNIKILALRNGMLILKLLASGAPLTPKEYRLLSMHLVTLQKLRYNRVAEDAI